MDIGNAIRKTRQERKIKQYALAEKAGVSATHLSQIENGSVFPRHDLIGRIAAILQVSTGFLYFRGIDKNDFPKNKRDLFDALYPTIQHIMIQLI